MNDSKFFESFAKSIKQSIHTTAPARVISYSPSRKTASLKLLYKKKTKSGSLTEYPVIQNAPVLAHVEEHIKTGSVVFVAFAERSLDNLSGSRVFDPDSIRMHDISDAIVMGVWNG